MKQLISHNGWFPASTGHLDELGLKCGGAHGPGNETHLAGIAWGEVEAGCGEFCLFVCWMTAR